MNEDKDARIAELERKLAEQQADNRRLVDRVCNAMDATKELNALLSEAKEEGRREAIPVLLLALYNHQGANSTVGQAIRKFIGIGQYEQLTKEHLAMFDSATLSAAPQPEPASKPAEPEEVYSPHTIIKEEK